MEKLENLTEADIKNGVLNRMLANAGIDSVPDYVKQFHQETEDLIIRQIENPDPNKTDNDHEIASPANIQSWLQHMAPDNVYPSNHSTTSETTTAPAGNGAPVDGNLGIWLTDWSKHIAEQPPPTSLDNWLQGLVPENMHELIGKTNTSKARLNNYLNAAQDVLSKHGYNVSNEITPTANVKTKTGVFGNVKHMYFLWKTLDKNHDRQITVEDVQIMLQEQGLGFLSKQVAQSLFEMVDSNHDGKLQFRDCIALMGIIKQLVGAVGSANAHT